MSIVQHRRKTKILDGPISLGRGNIIPGSMTVDSQLPPAEMQIDLEAGTVQWADQNNLGDPGPYLFEFDYDDLSEERQSREDETQEADQNARQYFASRTGVVDFIRLTPVEQAAQIDAMDLTQLKEVVKHLTVLVSAEVRKRYL